MSDVQIRRQLGIADGADSVLWCVSIWLDDAGVDWLSVAQPLNSRARNTGDLDLRLDILVVVNNFVLWLEKESWLLN